MARRPRPRGGYGPAPKAKPERSRRRREFEETVLAYVRSHRRKGRAVRAHPRRVHHHRSLVGPAEKLYPWGTLYHCSTCGEPVIRDERSVRRFGPRRG